MEAADSIAASLDACQPAALAPADGHAAEYQPVLEMAQAYDDLAEDLRDELDRCFAGEMTLAQAHALAQRLVWRVEPDGLTWIVARLLTLTSEYPAGGGFGPVDVDIDLSALERGAMTANAVARAGEGPSIETGDLQ